MTTRTTTIIGSEPITLVEAKAHLKVDYSTDDDLITALITAAREHCENYTQRMIVNQRRETVLDSFPAAWYANPYAEITVMGPVTAVESITYENGGESPATLAVANYRVNTDAIPCRISPADSWPGDAQDEPGGIKITYTGGHSDVADITQVIKQAMLLQIGDWYENRTDQARTLITASKRLLDLVRVQIF